MFGSGWAVMFRGDVPAGMLGFGANVRFSGGPTSELIIRAIDI
jgi:hypothetical protein